jgi:hypothetical protein
MAIEHGWLIEHGPGSGPAYLRIWRDGPSWTLDPYKATRFARRECAERAAECFGPENARVCEHAFEAGKEASHGE